MLAGCGTGGIERLIAFATGAMGTGGTGRFTGRDGSRAAGKEGAEDEITGMGSVTTPMAPGVSARDMLPAFFRCSSTLLCGCGTGGIERLTALATGATGIGDTARFVGTDDSWAAAKDVP